MDLNELKWSERILEAAEIGEEKLPDLYPSTHVAGEVTGSVAAECGLAPGTPIIIGGGDGVCAAVGAGSVREGDTFNYLGSSSWVAMTSAKPDFCPQLRTYNWAHMVPGMYSPNGTMQAAGNSYQFIKKTICKDLEKRGCRKRYQCIRTDEPGNREITGWSKWIIVSAIHSGRAKSKMEYECKRRFCRLENGTYQR